MKFFLFLLVPCILLAQQIPFSRGVNLSAWFQEDSPRKIQFTKYTKKDFENLKTLGVDIVRLPINFHAMTGGPTEYIVDPLLFDFLDQVIDWAEELELHLIIDNHSFDPAVPTDSTIVDILLPVWQQIASRYKERSRNIYYEILNEPHGISEAIWNEIQQRVIERIRTVDTVHTIIVGAANWNSYENLFAMPVYNDTNLIYTFHFYDPFIFTHQGATWVEPSLVSLAQVPFPYSAERMPILPQELRGTWVETAYNYYAQNGTVAKIKQQLDVAKNFKTSRQVPVFCGEFGVYMPNSPDTDRVYWYRIVREYLEEHNIPWTIWDYQGGFGVFNKNSDELFEHDLNIPLLYALGLNIPPQLPYERKADTSDIYLYSDYIGEKIRNASYSNGILDFYSQDYPFERRYCIYWKGAHQYQAIAFDFKPNKDLSYLRSQSSVLSFYVRCHTPDVSFDVRFVDSKTSDEDRPWRMRATIDSSRCLFNGTWQNVTVALSSYTEHGAWDNGWYEPLGLFDWTDVDRFEIVAEHTAFSDIELWFDEIKITSSSPSLTVTEVNIPQRTILCQNYPNPFNPSTTIAYELSRRSFVILRIFDLLGREIEILVYEEQQAGIYNVQWNASRYSSGTYIVQLIACDRYAQTQVQYRTMNLLK